MEQAELRHRYKDSPVGLRLIEFLATSTKEDFKTNDAVTFIYKGDKEEYSVLENRYFKLRKKIYDELQQLRAQKGGVPLPEEEDMLNHCKEMIAAGDKKEAYKLLVELEKTCWERNIFELLPSVLDNMIFCNQATNDREKNAALYPLLEKAIELQYDLNRAIMNIRKIYEIAISTGPAQSKKLLQTLKDFAEKNSKYPRFAMYYHYVSVSYKLSSMEYTQNMQVISRHLAEFKKLYAKHPLIPVIIYKANHAKLFHYHFSQITTFIHTNKLEFEEAYESVKEMWALANSSDSLFRSYRSDSLYFNLFTLQCMTRRYKGAYDTCELYSAFLRDEKRLDRISFMNTMKCLLYVTAYPQTFKMDVPYLHEQVDEYIKMARKAENIQIPFVQAMLFKAEMYLLNDNVKQAAKLIEDKEVQRYLNTYNLQQLFNSLMELLQKQGDKSKAMSELIQKAQQHRFKVVHIDEMIALNWLIAYAEAFRG